MPEKEINNHGFNYLNLLESIIETSYDGIYITDKDANTVYVNKDSSWIWFRYYYKKCCT